jgi:hypothetical protein
LLSDSPAIRDIEYGAPLIREAHRIFAGTDGVYWTQQMFHRQSAADLR